MSIGAQMTALSEILELSDEQRGAEYYRVAVDGESFTPPVGLKEIGFLLKLEDDDIDEELIDVVISYGLAGVSVILEVPHDVGPVDAKYLMSVSANAGFSISLLPPSGDADTAEARAEYQARLVEFVEAYLNHRNFAHFVYPVTSYLEYLFIERMRPGVAFEPTDPYILATFHEPVPVEFADQFKAAMREKIHAHFGGEAGFAAFAKAMIYRIYKQTEENARQLTGGPDGSGPDGGPQGDLASAAAE